MGKRSVVLVPGAWMGSWVWEPTALLLRERGLTAITLTLEGLEAGFDPGSLAEVTLESHVQQVVALLDAAALADVLLVGHSYSGVVVGQVADRRPGRVAHTMFVEAFLPRDGRSLLDDWGDAHTRSQERADVEQAGAWAPPTQGLELEPDLDAQTRGWLAANFVPHPPRTILDPAEMARPVEELGATFVSCARDADAPLPASVERLARDAGWDVQQIVAGHWPMVSRPAVMADLIAAAAS